MPISTNAPFNEFGQSMILRDIENLYLIVGAGQNPSAGASDSVQPSTVGSVGEGASQESQVPIDQSTAGGSGGPSSPVAHINEVRSIVQRAATTTAASAGAQSLSSWQPNTLTGPATHTITALNGATKAYLVAWGGGGGGGGGTTLGGGGGATGQGVATSVFPISVGMQIRVNAIGAGGAGSTSTGGTGGGTSGWIGSGATPFGVVGGLGGNGSPTFFGGEPATSENSPEAIIQGFRGGDGYIGNGGVGGGTIYTTLIYGLGGAGAFGVAVAGTAGTAGGVILYTDGLPTIT